MIHIKSRGWVFMISLLSSLVQGQSSSVESTGNSWALPKAASLSSRQSVCLNAVEWMSKIVQTAISGSHINHPAKVFAPDSMHRGPLTISNLHHLHVEHQKLIRIIQNEWLQKVVFHSSFFCALWLSHPSKCSCCLRFDQSKGQDLQG